MNTPAKPISYRRRPLRRKQSGLVSGSRWTVPVSLGRPPSLHGLRRPARRASRMQSGPCRSPRVTLFARFPGTTRTCDFHGSCIDGVRPEASRRGPGGESTPRGNPWISRFPLMVCGDMPWFSDRAGSPSSRDFDERDVAFQRPLPCRHPGVGISRLNSPACPSPNFQRFSHLLAEVAA